MDIYRTITLRHSSNRNTLGPGIYPGCSSSQKVRGNHFLITNCRTRMATFNVRASSSSYPLENNSKKYSQHPEKPTFATTIPEIGFAAEVENSFLPQDRPPLAARCWPERAIGEEVIRKTFALLMFHFNELALFGFAACFLMERTSPSGGIYTC